jgi:hypothetical protein
MNDTLSIGTAQPQPPATKAVTAFNDAICRARFALHNETLDCAVVRLEQGSRIAGEACNPHARELANFASALKPAVETIQLVEMCFADLFPEQ